MEKNENKLFNIKFYDDFFVSSVVVVVVLVVLVVLVVEFAENAPNLKTVSSCLYKLNSLVSQPALACNNEAYTDGSSWPQPIPHDVIPTWTYRFGLLFNGQINGPPPSPCKNPAILPLDFNTKAQRFLRIIPGTYLCPVHHPRKWNCRVIWTWTSTRVFSSTTLDTRRVSQFSGLFFVARAGICPCDLYSKPISDCSKFDTNESGCLTVSVLSPSSRYATFEIVNFGLSGRKLRVE